MYIRFDCFSCNDSSESITKRINAVLRIPSTDGKDDEANIRPKRKVPAVSPIIEDFLDDSDEDPHYRALGDESSPDEDSGSDSSDNNNAVAPKQPAKSSRECLIDYSVKFRTLYKVEKLADILMWITTPHNKSERYVRISRNRDVRQ